MQSVIDALKAARDRLVQTLDAELNPDAIDKDLKTGAKALEKALDALGSAAEAGGKLAHVAEVSADIALSATATEGQNDPTVEKLRTAASALKDALHVFDAATDATAKVAKGASDVLKQRADNAADQAVELAVEAHDAVASTVNTAAGREVVPRWRGHKVPLPVSAHLAPGKVPDVAPSPSVPTDGCETPALPPPLFTAASDTDGKLRHPAVR